jgi:hypothetical protein
VEPNTEIWGDLHLSFSEKNLAIETPKIISFSNFSFLNFFFGQNFVIELRTYGWMGMVWFGGQSKRMSYEDVKAVQIRQGASAQSSWVQEMQQGSNQSIIISEFLNAETTKEQIAQADVPGVMVSDDMVAMVLAMVAEDKKVSYILSELFAQEVP